MKKLDPAKIKKRIMDIGLKTGAGHIASALTLVNPLCDIYNKWPDNVIIISKGHGVLAQYVILNELGKFPDKLLDTYYQDGGLSEHSTLDQKHGVYASTGSLGHGLGIGIGYAIADPDNLVIVFLSDGELDCGTTLASFKIINKLELNNIMVIVDHNRLQAFSEHDQRYMVPRYQTYNSVKGEAWGDISNTMKSHYVKVTQEIYDTWMKEFPIVDQVRIDNLKEVIKLKKKEDAKHNK